MLYLLRRIPRTLDNISHYFYMYWNPIKFRLVGIKCGKGLIALNMIYIDIRPGARVSIGDNFCFTSGNNINPLCRNIRGGMVALRDAEIVIGNNYGLSSTSIWAHKKITIGNNVKIGGNVTMTDSDSHSLDYQLRRTGADGKDAKTAEIVIGDDVLIGTGCIILKGVHIGPRSVIGAGSVVVGEIPADCIAAGNPCKVIRFLNQNK